MQRVRSHAPQMQPTPRDIVPAPRLSCFSSCQPNQQEALMYWHPAICRPLARSEDAESTLHRGRCAPFFACQTLTGQTVETQFGQRRSCLSLPGHRHPVLRPFSRGRTQRMQLIRMLCSRPPEVMSSSSKDEGRETTARRLHPW